MLYSIVNKISKYNCLSSFKFQTIQAPEIFIFIFKFRNFNLKEDQLVRMCWLEWNVMSSYISCNRSFDYREQSSMFEISLYIPLIFYSWALYLGWFYWNSYSTFQYTYIMFPSSNYIRTNKMNRNININQIYITTPHKLHR